MGESEPAALERSERAPSRCADPPRGAAGLSGLALATTVIVVAEVLVAGAIIANDWYEYTHPTVYGGPAGSPSIGGGIESNPGLVPMGAPSCGGGGADGGGGDAGRKPLSFDSRQVGQKFGEHFSDEPGFQTPEQYQELANQIYGDPDAVVSTATNGDLLYQVGRNILWVTPEGFFRSLYQAF
jgi:hypothetical protein